MDAKSYNQFLLSAFSRQLQSGNTTLSTDSIVSYLKEHQSELAQSEGVSEIDVKRYEAELQKWIEDCRSHNQSELEGVRATISAGQNALRSAFLMNGGASVAILAFIGHLATVDPTKISSFAICLLWFVSGVVAITIASGATYLSQWFYSDWENRSWTRKAGTSVNILSIVLGLSSYGLFVKGVLVAYTAFSSYG